MPPFTGSTFLESQTQANFEFVKDGVPTRKFTQNNIGAVGRYMRIHSSHPTDIELKFAEIEVIGRTFTGTLSNDSLKDFGVSIYPNPTEGNVNIAFDNTQTNVAIEIYNILGQQLLSKKHDIIKQTEINIGGNAGIYFVKISGDTNLEITRKIIKN